MYSSPSVKHADEGLFHHQFFYFECYRDVVCIFAKPFAHRFGQELGLLVLLLS